MIPRRGRLALWCLALLLSLSLLVKGRVPTGKGEGAAFFSPRAGTATVRLAGDVPRPGLYRFPDGTSPAAAIKMTLPEVLLPAAPGARPEAPLVSGDVVTLTMRGGQVTELSKGSMAAKERMLLGIPLDADLLGIEEWSCLPGIGPVLAGRIVADRQKNGAFQGVRGVLRVPGIGPGKLAAIERYF